MSPIEKKLKGATWVQIPRWPHLEYPFKRGDPIRWPKGKGIDSITPMPMWRCIRCKKFIDFSEKGVKLPQDWDTMTPCSNEICKAYFYLRWPGGTI